VLVHALTPLVHAQFMHRMEVRITRGAEGKTGRAFIGDMTEEMSVQLASKLASEGFIFMVSRAPGMRICRTSHERSSCIPCPCLDRRMANPTCSPVGSLQVGVVIVAFEYDRQRRKEVLKKKMEAAEQERMWQAAHEERRVSCCTCWELAAKTLSGPAPAPVLGHHQMYIISSSPCCGTVYCCACT
jgi:hypothetical protein